MRRLLVLLSVLMGLGALVPSIATAQDATPEAESDTPAENVPRAAPTRTDVHFVLPLARMGCPPI